MWEGGFYDKVEAFKGKFTFCMVGYIYPIVYYSIDFWKPQKLEHLDKHLW